MHQVAVNQNQAVEQFADTLIEQESQEQDLKPKQGSEADTIEITVKANFLTRLDALIGAREMTRAQCLEEILSQAEQYDAWYREQIAEAEEDINQGRFLTQEEMEEDNKRLITMLKQKRLKKI